MKAIETSYKGYLFRSRLEARWAVFFDSMGIQWVYEAEGFDLGDGTRYLPDFWFPQFQKWGEVKPMPFSLEEEQKAALLPDPCLMLVGVPDFRLYCAAQSLIYVDHSITISFQDSNGTWITYDEASVQDQFDHYRPDPTERHFYDVAKQGGWYSLIPYRNRDFWYLDQHHSADPFENFAYLSTLIIDISPHLVPKYWNAIEYSRSFRYERKPL